MLAATRICSPADQLRLRPQRSCSKKISVPAIAIQRLGDDAYIGDTGLLDRVHHRGERAKRHIFISPYEDELALRVPYFLMQLGGDIVDIDRVASQKYPLLLVNADHHALLGDLFYGSRSRDVDFNARLQDRRGHHENDQQYQHYVDQGGDVDIRKGSLGAAVGCGESHYRRPSAPTGDRTSACWRSTAFIISRAKSSLRAANSRMEFPIRL